MVRIHLFNMVVPLALLLAAAGCTRTTGKLTSVISGDVERIPSRLAFYPLLSTSIGGYKAGWPSARATLKVQRWEDNVVIVPPTETEMMVTRESETLTGLISMELSSIGFSLQELPVRILPEDEESKKPGELKSAFAISLNMLEQLREQYDLEAIIIGNAFFVMEVYRAAPPYVTAVSAYLKVIDIESLEILGQVNYFSEYSGKELDDLAEDIAAVMAEMAGIKLEE
ncbi:MAG: hypothetical protein GTO42_01400 [Candidatus Latescibacteria bacterium]|nr:hypothetical protein [Candidatus Latescibacterota bacterium]NIO27185.1 hypothetical protein [Candidatus Latescibacterota bacterium]NIO54709.1 hypothetical protein [Candidatus Latescibacterota bacterium]NIT00792.1 hypothetical protein [Candidatus Latescibacterota bacterium]NIT37715.1 hypothetical protein [Candidatus Latescibacterota bacterium]